VGYNDIQVAVGAASAGDTINVCAGTYTVPFNQTIVVNKALTLRGANYQVDPTAQPSVRNAESKIVVNHSSGRAMTISASNVSVDGFEFEVQASRDAINVMPTLAAGGSVTVSNLNFSNNIFRSSTTTSGQKNGIVFGENNTNANPSATLDTANITGVTINRNLFNFAAWNGSSRGIPMTAQFDWLNYSGFSITNNRFQMGAVNGNAIAGTAVPSRHMMTNYVITGNTFSGYAGIDLTKSSNPLIENNTFSSLNYRAIAVGSTNGGAVRGNTIDGTGAALSSGGQFYGYGVDLYGGTDFGNPANGPTGNNSGLVVENNAISNFTHPTETNQNFRAINVRQNAGPGMIIRNNAINNVQNGVLFASTTVNAQTVENNSFTNAVTAIRNNSTSVAIGATCNWYGTLNANTIASKIVGSVTNSPWLTDGTDSNTSAIGFQPVSGACGGTPVVATLASSTNITCNGLSNGAVNITVSGGATPYT
ncbi:MAG: NosD domain-containing protein, partial [Bacteroidota bacterium]